MAGSNARVQQSATAQLESKDRSEALAHMHLTKILRAYILQMITGTCQQQYIRTDDRHQACALAEASHVPAATAPGSKMLCS